MQPLNITSLLVKEYESEVEYSTTIIELVDIYYVLSNMAKLFRSGADIGLSLVEIETRLSNLTHDEPKMFHYPNDEWFAETFNCRSTIWRDSAYCFSMFYTCRLFLYRLKFHKNCDMQIISSSCYSHNPDIIPSLFSNSQFEHYFQLFGESAILLSKYCNSLVKLGLSFVNVDFYMALFQSIGALLILALVHKSSKEKKKHNDIMNRIDASMKFMQTYHGFHAHMQQIFKAFVKLKAQVFSIDTQQGIRRAFDYVHETVDIQIPSIFGKDIDMLLERSSFENDSSCTSPSATVKNVNITDVEFLNDIISKFAI